MLRVGGDTAGLRFDRGHSGGMSIVDAPACHVIGMRATGVTTSSCAVMQVSHGTSSRVHGQVVV